MEFFPKQFVKFSKLKHKVHCCKIVLQIQEKRQLFSEIEFELQEIGEEYIFFSRFCFWHKNNN